MHPKRLSDFGGHIKGGVDVIGNEMIGFVGFLQIFECDLPSVIVAGNNVRMSVSYRFRQGILHLVISG